MYHKQACGLTSYFYFIQYLYLVRKSLALHWTLELDFYMYMHVYDSVCLWMNVYECILKDERKTQVIFFFLPFSVIQGFTSPDELAWNLKFSCLKLSSAKIKDMYHHAQLLVVFLKCKFLSYTTRFSMKVFVCFFLFLLLNISSFILR